MGHLGYAGTIILELNLDWMYFSPGVHAAALIILGHRLTASVNLCAAYRRSHLESSQYRASRRTFHSTNLLRLKVFV